MKNADMPAMPTTDIDLLTERNDGLDESGRYAFSRGLTKREMFAMHAMQGFLAANSGWKNSSPMTNSEIAQEAVDLADDLLEALER